MIRVTPETLAHKDPQEHKVSLVQMALTALLAHKVQPVPTAPMELMERRASRDFKV